MSNYKIIDVEGIGPVYGEKLLAAGIKDTDALLEKCSKPAGRKALEEETGISGKLILTWVNHADLFRIKGIGPQFSELLEAAGVDTVKELATRRADNLAAKMLEVNEQKHLTKVVPTEKMLQDMIDQAKNLPGVVTY
jgi:predicted flap endonuclease-1-like 5' DNA nuclease